MRGASHFLLLEEARPARGGINMPQDRLMRALFQGTYDASWPASDNVATRRYGSASGRRAMTFSDALGYTGSTVPKTL